MGNNHFKGIEVIQALPSSTDNNIVAIIIKNKKFQLGKFELNSEYTLSKYFNRKKRNMTLWILPKNRLI